jgi:bacterioferritin-associated ferredoxin
MIVCVCRRVSDRDIERAARDGCPSFDALQDELQVATACGACTDCARKTFDAHCQGQPVGARAHIQGVYSGRASAVGTLA